MLLSTHRIRAITIINYGNPLAEYGPGNKNNRAMKEIIPRNGKQRS
jgi:hypothetical protein